MGTAALASGVLFTLLLAAGPAAAPVPLSHSDPNDDVRSRVRCRTSTDLAVLDVSITDLHGKPVSGLGAGEADRRAALYGAVLMAAHDLTAQQRQRGAEHRQAIVVLSGGEDNFCVSDLEGASEQATRRGIPLYGVSLRTDSKQRPQPPSYTLTTLAKVPADRTARIRSIDDLVPLYQAIADEVRAQYRLGYEPPDANADGRRGVSVRVREPLLRTRTRAGYYAPRRSAATVQKGRP